MTDEERSAAELLPCPWGPQKCHGDCQVCQRRPAVAQALAEAYHCKDCCCARSWAALGITGYTGMSIVEHIEALKAEAAALRQRVAELEGLPNELKGPDVIQAKKDLIEHIKQAARVEGLRRAQEVLQNCPQGIFCGQEDLLDAEIAALERNHE